MTDTEAVEAALTTPPAPRRDAVRRSVVAAALLGAALFVLSVSAVLLRPEGAPTALFWPAAGVAVAAALRTRGRDRRVVVVVVVLATTAANLVAGRTLELAAWFGFINVAEACLVALLMGPRTVIDDAARAVRFLAAATAGAVCAGVLAGTAVVLTGSASFAPTWWAVACSHGAAVLLLVPVLLFPRDDARTAAPRRDLETAAVVLTTVLVTALVFRPGQTLPIAFLPMPFVVWAAVRLSPARAGLVALAMTVTATALTIADGGPFAAARSSAVDAGTTVSLVQLHAVATAVMMLLTATLTLRRRRDVAELQRAEALYRDGWSGSLTGMLVLSLEPARDGERLRVVTSNPAAARLLEAGSVSDLVGHWWCGPVPAEDRAELAQVVDELVAGRGTGWRGDLRFGAWRPASQVGGDVPTDVVRWMEVSISLVDGPSEHPRFAVQMHDVTGRRQAEERLQQQALHDHLTGLPNRALLQDRLAVALAASAREGRDTGLLLLDLDGFKRVNDTAGHGAGDEVLREVARRLLAVARSGDTVARIGGDEFVVLCGGAAGAEGLDRLSQRIRSSIGEPVEVDGVRHTVGVSVGAVLAAPGDDPATVLAHADHAMYRQKRRGQRTAQH